MKNLKYEHMHIDGFTQVPNTQVAVSDDTHEYFIPYKFDADAPVRSDQERYYDTLNFIHLDKNGNYKPGITDEQLLEVLIHRTEYFQTTVPCEENEVTLMHLRSALQAKLDRTAKRQAQNVEGTYQKH